MPSLDNDRTNGDDAEGRGDDDDDAGTAPLPFVSELGGGFFMTPFDDEVDVTAAEVEAAIDEGGGELSDSAISS
jgi:hypothetical protein